MEREGAGKKDLDLFLFLPYYLLVMPLAGQTQCKARGQGSLSAAVHRSPPSRAKIREEKDREENALLMMVGAGRGGKQRVTRTSAM